MLKYNIIIFLLNIFLLLILKNYLDNNIYFVEIKDINNIFKKDKIQEYLSLINDDIYNIRMNSDIYNTYEKNILEFTNKEKKFLIKKIKKIKKKINFSNQWNLIKTRNNLEYGRPFTLDNYIFIPENIIFNNDINETLLHEQLHIHQRNNQNKYNNLYEKYLDWYLDNNLIIPKYISDNMIVNPDGTNNNWYFYYKNLKIIPFLIYENNYNIKYYILNNNKIVKEYTNSKEIDSFLKNKYNISNNYYHPNEIIVTILTDYFIYNKKIDKHLLHFIN